jgi:uncharacterized membrane protein YebE (DUF533 family)
MTTSVLYRSLSILTSCALISCAPAGTSTVQDAAVGGLGGAAVGAGTGAIIGSVISNGDVAKSALVGGAIGIPVGIIAGLAFRNASQNGEIADQREAIEENKQHILQQERELEYMRNEIRDDSSSKTVNPGLDRIEHQYNGPSLGNPFRY